MLRICRLMRWRVTESRATFLETTTAYPETFEGIVAVKCSEVILFPVLRAEAKLVLVRRLRRGNTLYRDGQTLTADPATCLDYFTSRRRFTAREKTMGFRALSLFWLIGLFSHKIGLYTRY